MPWTYRKVDQHTCNKPKLYGPDAAKDVAPGDIWDCDDPTCGQRWIVRSDQRDGPYFERFRTSPMYPADKPLYPFDNR